MEGCFMRCINARWGVNDSYKDGQNESGQGHCQGPPVKQRHAKQRQAENDKFYVLRDDQFGFTVK
jgi:hypothetical protein